MDLLDHDGDGAIFHLNQRELLMLMALVQEGRDSFSCTAQTGRDLDSLFSRANALVETSRRQELSITSLRHRMGQVVPPETAAPDKKTAH